MGEKCRNMFHESINKPALLRAAFMTTVINLKEMKRATS